MKTLKNNILKITSIILIILIIFVLKNYYLEYKKNKPYKEELKSFKQFLERTKEENINIQKEVYSLVHPLEKEKEMKDKFGEANKDEKVIFISNDVLNSIEFPFIEK